MARPCLDDLGKWFAEYVRGKVVNVFAVGIVDGNASFLL